jgi:hypothetical protein
MTKELAKELAAVENAVEGLHQAGTIMPYELAQLFTEGKGGLYQAHHIIEQRWFKRFMEGNADEVPAVILTWAEHTKLTNKLAERALKQPPKNAAELWRIYQDVYRNEPYWLKAIESYFIK